MADHRPAMIKKFRALAYPVAAEVVALAVLLDKQLEVLHAEARSCVNRSGSRGNLANRRYGTATRAPRIPLRRTGLSLVPLDELEDVALEFFLATPAAANDGA